MPSEVVTYRFRDLLALEPLSAAELTFLLDQSKPFQEIQRHPLKKLATLRGKTVALAFFETSTGAALCGRTDISSRPEQTIPGNSAPSVKKTGHVAWKNSGLGVLRDFHAHPHQL